ncbi:hypothetical protein [Candidatus Ichthyocystis hellenicum]|uniref:hypothetical protein n=1 Tax=Candidatus Ichthyocystis hellenicum TaxID=1561003 RepID=UPI000B89FB8F|nr:hypothetical protein [Candidatus Ichthyocystis hellenicum]
MNRDFVSFSKYDIISVSDIIAERDDDDVFRSFFLHSADEFDKLSCVFPGFGAAEGSNGFADSMRRAASFLTSTTASTSASVFSPFPVDWYRFCEQNFRERNYDISSNPREFRSLLESVNELTDLIGNARDFMEINLRLSPDDISWCDIYSSLFSLIGGINQFISILKGFRVNIRKSVSFLAEALLLQLKHSLMAGSNIMMMRSSVLIPLVLPRFRACLGSSVEDTKKLLGSIASVVSICNFIPLEEMIKMFKRKDPVSYKSEIDLASSFLREKYPALIEKRRLKISRIGEHFSDADASE